MPTIVSTGDAEQMYQNTIVEIDGQPLIVHGWADGEKLACMNILTGEQFSTAADADKIMAPTVHQLGYVQIGSEAVFLERRPVRQYRVGWSDRNVTGMPSTSQLLRGKVLMDSFRRMLKREYPSLNRAFAAAQARDSRLAFDRQFAVDYRGRIIYKGSHVADYDGVTFKINEARKYLLPQLEQLQNV